MCKAIPGQGGGSKKNNEKKWRAEEEEKHKGSLPPKNILRNVICHR
jgi:hypothetical protein